MGPGSWPERRRLVALLKCSASSSLAIGQVISRRPIELRSQKESPGPLDGGAQTLELHGLGTDRVTIML